MAFVNALFHPMLAAAGATAATASLHTGDPGTTGAAEVSGGDYERVPVTWGTPSNGRLQADGEVVWLVPSLGSGEITHVGLWGAEGEWLGDAQVTVPQPFPTPGTATATSLVLDMTTGVMVARVGAE